MACTVAHNGTDDGTEPCEGPSYDEYRYELHRTAVALNGGDYRASGGDRSQAVARLLLLNHDPPLV
jgi:hypothetical protein